VTPASTYTDDVTLKIKKERLALVQKTIDKSTEQISKAMIGSVQKVLVENKAKKGDNLFGRTLKKQDVIVNKIKLQAQASVS
jgi:tRNA-2-methylthio-N6-dimethylallyladenosine synthase